jgi:hypothetical protein
MKDEPCNTFFFAKINSNISKTTMFYRAQTNNPTKSASQRLIEVRSRLITDMSI